MRSISASTARAGRVAGVLAAVLALAAAGVLAVRAVAAQAGATLTSAMPAAVPRGAAAQQPRVGGLGIGRIGIGRLSARGLSTRSASTDGWQMAVQRHYGRAYDASGYSAVVAPSRSDIWVFGGTNPGGASAPVALRRDGSRWVPQALPGGLSGFISDASAPGRRDIWAVGDMGSYVLHWNGARWAVASGWHAGRGTVTGITAVSPADVWVFGTAVTGTRGLGTWHFNGRSWAQVTGRAAEVHQASAVSAHDIWAVAASRRGGFIEHYDGRSWRRADAGSLLGRASLDSVAALSRDNVWVVGNLTSGPDAGRLVVGHLRGRRWLTAVTRWRAQTERLAADGSGGAWITADVAGTRNEALVGHLSPGYPPTWTTVQHGLGSGITDIDVSRATGAAWLTGGFLTRAGGDAAVWSRAGRKPMSAEIGNLLRPGEPLAYRARRPHTMALPHGQWLAVT